MDSFIDEQELIMLRKFLLPLLFFTTFSVFSSDFSVDEYKEFLQKNQDMSIERFYEMYPPGEFYKEANLPKTIAFLDSVRIKYKLTHDELSLLMKHGFVVTERLSYSNMWDAMEDVRNKDLPIFISSDMLLHALHMSYDKILKYLEQETIIPALDKALGKMHDELDKYNTLGAPAYLVENINDVDVYITVARNLLRKSPVSSKFGNSEEVQKILKMIKDEDPADYPLFSSTPKKIDFSQFTVRGHYSYNVYLGKYFQSMMWLGRIQFYLSKPKSDGPSQTDEDIQRQIIDAALLTDITFKSGANELMNKIDMLIKTLVGESDNVTYDNMYELMKELEIEDAAEFRDMDLVEDFQELLETKSYAGQKILSQILMSDPLSPEQITPSSSFLMMGQRFVIDSYITGNVVYDKIIYNNKKVMRMLPSSLDVLFALGNNASADLLEPEFSEYPYMPNLAALRYLLDGFDSDFWEASYYTGWLNSIRKLNAPEESELGKLPQFMRTAAWWQSKMNTQLASWAQLRHDNLLYAKQSYSGGAGCFYPTAYLEPETDLYAELANLAERATEIFRGFDAEYFIIMYFEELKEVSERLAEISKAELSGTMTEDDVTYLKQAYSMSNTGCVVEPDGWFARLFFPTTSQVREEDYVVADLHTAPTDAAGNMVGWVWHAGTGHINTLFAITEDENGNPTVFTGPVLSYHEMVALNFTRHTDEQWTAYFLEDENDLTGTISRPDFTNLYLTDINGSNAYKNPPILPTSVNSSDEPFSPDAVLEIQTAAYPNPFRDNVMIGFKIPAELTGSSINVAIYDVSGRLLKELYDNRITTGNYSVSWDGTDSQGSTVNNGTYYYTVQINDNKYSGQVVLVK
jgi:hypothetical protein